MEIWKDVKGYEGLYQVSNLGRVKSLKSGKEKIMVGGFTLSGYHCVTLLKNKTQKTRTTHRMVAESFIENNFSYSCVNHKNGIKGDNRVENIEWCSHKQNSNHAVKFGFIKSGEKSYMCKTKEETIKKIFVLKNQGFSRKEILNALNISIHIYKDVISGKTWKNLNRRE